MITPTIGIKVTNFVTDKFEGAGLVDGTRTNFGLSTSSTTDNTFVFIDGVQQNPSEAYSISGAVLSFTEAPQLGSVIVARYA